ncbi:hypothetical protein EHYA_06913 [Embleya hyalina]|uniref:Uncharacterized protein n=1 Tax=Embleya hyalina TaxID=516124 RepID=A0A401YXB7_9ACTN|nr:hypothetical protein EHYA_06913 [Embleya hyalina]
MTAGVRQRHPERVLPVAEPWAAPFVIRPVGEYVEEIQHTIRDGPVDIDIPGTPQHDAYGAVLAANPDSPHLTSQREVGPRVASDRPVRALAGGRGVATVTFRDAGRVAVAGNSTRGCRSSPTVGSASGGAGLRTQSPKRRIVRLPVTVAIVRVGVEGRATRFRAASQWTSGNSARWGRSFVNDSPPS